MAALRRAVRKHVAMEKAAMENTLEVPEEPDVEVAESPESPAPISFFTAVKLVCRERVLPRIAQWMAKSYGYVARKKEAYKSKEVTPTIPPITSFNIHHQFQRNSMRHKQTH